MDNTTNVTNVASAMNPASAPAVRLRHYQGQRLLGGDLQDEYNNLTWLRDLHVVALHNTWGIALGLDVQYGAGAIVVAPGFAYDALGREIILATPYTVPGPALYAPAQTPDGIYHLVIGYDASLNTPMAGRDDAPCIGNARAGRDRPAFAWRRADETRLGVDVPLLGVYVLGGAIAETSLDPTVRHYTQPMARPHIASGVTPLQRRWRLWRMSKGKHTIGFGLRVDTSAAGFVATPHYLADLVTDSGGVVPGGAAQAAKAAQALQPPNGRNTGIWVFTSISSLRASGFTFRVVFAGNEAAESALKTLFSRYSDGTLPLRVAWLGVESAALGTLTSEWGAAIAGMTQQGGPGAAFAFDAGRLLGGPGTVMGRTPPPIW